MRTVNPTSVRRVSRSRRVAVFMTLALGLGWTAAPGYGQAQEDESAAFEVSRGKKKNRKRQSRPIKLGTSGSNVESMDISGIFLFCCGGTLGGLVEKDGIQYVLSNNHVIARGNSGKKGEAILQPSYLDQSCPASDEDMDTVAHLTSRKKVRFGLNKRNKVDVAIAEVVPGAVQTNGEIVHIGVPGTNPVEAVSGLQVKKSGRSTGLTRGFVESVGNTVDIPDFPLDCAGDEIRLARFTNQIFVRGIDGPFEKPGDSGSMVYQDVDQCPAPVGLLFAGNGEVAALNPASTVLKTVKRLKPRGGQASFVGCESSQLQVSSAQKPILRPERVREALLVKQNWEDELLDLPSVHSVGVGVSLSGSVEPAIYVYTSENREAMMASLPEELEGFRVEVVETPPFRVTCGQQGLAYSRD